MQWPRKVDCVWNQVCSYRGGDLDFQFLLVVTTGITRRGRQNTYLRHVGEKSVYLGIRLWITPNKEALSSSEMLLSIHLCTIHGVTYHIWNLHEYGCDNLKFRIIFRECAGR
jgi:hypothetical protein